jgi:hypothetical protein
MNEIEIGKYIHVVFTTKIKGEVLNIMTNKRMPIEYERVDNDFIITGEYAQRKIVAVCKGA